MSNSYFMICADCEDGLALLLGKAIFVHYEGREKQNFGFASLGGDMGGHWQSAQKGCEELSHFLMLHRGHELRVVPDVIDGPPYGVDLPQGFPSDDDTSDPNFNRSVFFARDPVKPDPEADAANLPAELIRRLREKHSRHS